MMRKRHVAVLAVGLLGPPLLLSGLPARAATPDYTQYAEHTTVAGKLPVDLRGVWFIVAQPTVTKDGKSKTLPQLIAVSQEGAKLTWHLMDVRLPKGMADAVRVANEKLNPWSPSDADIALLRQQWSKLPPATDKDPKAGDLWYAQVEFALAAPERYADAFPRQDDALRGVLAESGFSLQVNESYRPLPVPPGSNIGQLMVRKTIYGVRKASDARLEGKLVVGFVAATAYNPLPFNSGGHVQEEAQGEGPLPRDRPAPALSLRRLVRRGLHGHQGADEEARHEGGPVYDQGRGPVERPPAANRPGQDHAPVHAGPVPAAVRERCRWPG